LANVPVLRPKEVVKGFQKFGWTIARQSGSHIIMTKSGHISTLSIPNHATIARGTLRALIGKAGVTIEEFVINL
jgi:predicted RNA binding protein YcfA (HicA-like mRNA interferase family)